MMKPQNQYLVFTIDEQRYAIALSSVEKVIRAVELISLPEAPEFLLGLMNMQGKIIPVINIRKRFHLPSYKIRLNDRIIICQASGQTIAFMVDTVQGVVEFPQEQIDKARQIFPEMEHYIEGIGKLDDTTVLIYDLEKLFSPQDINKLDQATKNPQPASGSFSYLADGGCSVKNGSYYTIKLSMAELEKFTLRIDPSSVYFFRFILEGYDNMFMLSTVDQRAGLVEVRAVKGSLKDLLLILRSLKSIIGLDRMDSRCNVWIMKQL